MDSSTRLAHKELTTFGNERGKKPRSCGSFNGTLVPAAASSAIRSIDVVPPADVPASFSTGAQIMFTWPTACNNIVQNKQYMCASFTTFCVSDTALWRGKRHTACTVGSTQRDPSYGSYVSLPSIAPPGSHLPRHLRSHR